MSLVQWGKIRKDEMLGHEFVLFFLGPDGSIGLEFDKR